MPRSACRLASITLPISRLSGGVRSTKDCNVSASILKWTETEGQKMAAALSFAPLPGNVRDRVLNVIGTLKP
jgi:hypothetical protein